MEFQVKDIYYWLKGAADQQPQEKVKKVNHKKIALVLPSGGLRGVMQATILSEIDEKLKDQVKDYKGLSHYMDYIAGTSIGSINAINFAIKNDDGTLKFNPQDGVNIFIDNGGKMLKPDGYFNIGITSPCYSNARIKEVLEGICGDTKFSDDRLSAKVLITSYSLEKAEPTIWSNIGTEEGRRQSLYHVWNIGEYKLSDAILASSAIPSYLPSHQVTYQRDDTTPKIYNEIDGAFFKSSPIKTLISDICSLDKVKASDLFVLSVGTGKVSPNLSHLIKGGQLPYIQHIGKIIWAIYDVAQRTDEQECISFIERSGGKCKVIDIELTEQQFANTVVDKLENIHEFKSVAEEYLAQNDSYINGIVNELADWINIPETLETVEESYFTMFHNKIIECIYGS